MHGLIDNYQLTVPAILRRAATVFGGRPIVSRSADGSVHRYTYREMAERAHRLGGALQEIGIRPGDRVATLAWNHHRHLEAYFAIPSIGAVLHTLNLRLHHHDVSYIASHAGDAALIVDESLLPLVARLEWPRTARHLIVMRDDGATLEAVRGDNWPEPIDYDTLLSGSDVAPIAHEVTDERSAAAMCYTSGTTGRPKGVVYSHRALALQALVLLTADNVGLSQRDVVMAVVPMFHINGWGLPFGAALAGSGLVLPGHRLDASSLLNLIASERVSLSGGVPTIWLSVLHMLDAQQDLHDVSGLRALIVGGSAVPEAMLRGYRERHGITIRQAWGMTETTSISTVCTLPTMLDDASLATQYGWLSRQGTPAPFFEIRARGDEGLIPWDGTAMGELEVRGPTVASAYFDEPGSADRFTDDGWFRTGDIVTIAPGGCVALRDRTRDLIRSGGEWISSMALENALMGHPAVAEAAVVAVPDAKWDERPLACVVLKPGATTTAEDLRQHLQATFAKWWLPDTYEFVDEIPRTSTGKFLKSALRDRFGATRPKPVDPA
jgi:fatty-acyl-CoA synthase